MAKTTEVTDYLTIHYILESRYTSLVLVFNDKKGRPNFVQIWDEEHFKFYCETFIEDMLW